MARLWARLFGAVQTRREAERRAEAAEAAVPSGPSTKLTTAEVAALLDDVFPQIKGEARLEEVAPLSARIRVAIAEKHLRPGDTVSGPTIFFAADVAFYAAVLGMIGREPMAVTTNLGVNFMRRPTRRDLIAEARILKLGRRLAVGEATVFSDGAAEPVAHAMVTYALPDRAAG